MWAGGNLKFLFKGQILLFTLGSSHWTVRLNAYKVHVVPALSVQLLAWGTIKKTYCRKSCRNYYKKPLNL